MTYPRVKPYLTLLILMTVCIGYYQHQKYIRNVLTKYTKRLRRPTKVLLFTYFRSGSTFLGETINRNPDAFYWFEPLRPIYRKYHIKSPYRKLENGTIGELQEDIVNEICQILVDLLNCDLSKLNDAILEDKFIYRGKSVSLISYASCMKQTRTDPISNSSISQCLPLATERCNNAQIRATKVIRFSSYMLGTLLDMDPEIKIVHYVRDPRAMFLSQKLGRDRSNTEKRVAAWARDWCHRLLEDHRQVRHLAERKDILELRYEDLATDYTRMIGDVYGYLGREIPDQVIDWFRTNTNATESNGIMGTRRNNSTLVAYRWQHSLPHTVANAIAECCREVLRIYRYR